MHRFSRLATAGVTLATLVAAGPAFAASSSQTTASGQQIVDSALTTVRQIEANSRYDAVLKNAKGLFIMPELVKGAFILGGEGAQGVLLKHNTNGSWSQPAFLTIGSISLGAQAGAKGGPAAMILMTDKALNDFTQANNLSLNGNAGLTIVNYSADSQAPVGKGDVIVWSNQSGAFAGINIGGADVMQNGTLDHSYYGKQVDAQKILNGETTNPGADKLVAALPA